MGLDMYFYKIKKVKNKTMQDLIVIQDKINYGDNENERKKLIKLYNDYLIKQNYEWTKKDYYNFDTEIGYFRKANAIHKYIVDNFNDGVDNCEPIILDKEKLKELQKITKELIYKCKLKNGKWVNGYTYQKNGNGELEKVYNYEKGYILDKKSQELASKLLPTCDGFFFGSTDYDQWYFNDLLELYVLLKEINKIDTNDYDIYYLASW